MYSGKVSITARYVYLSQNGKRTSPDLMLPRKAILRTDLSTLKNWSQGDFHISPGDFFSSSDFLYIATQVPVILPCLEILFSSEPFMIIFEEIAVT